MRLALPPSPRRRLLREDRACLKRALSVGPTAPRMATREAVGENPTYCLPLTIMSFLTDFTPLTLRAISAAFLMAAGDWTKPVSWTTPL